MTLMSTEFFHLVSPYDEPLIESDPPVVTVNSETIASSLFRVLTLTCELEWEIRQSKDQASSLYTILQHSAHIFRAEVDKCPELGCALRMMRKRASRAEKFLRFLEQVVCGILVKHTNLPSAVKEDLIIYIEGRNLGRMRKGGMIVTREALKEDAERVIPDLPDEESRKLAEQLHHLEQAHAALKFWRKSCRTIRIYYVFRLVTSLGPGVI